MPHVHTYQARSILTPQRAGFLASPPHPFTHSLSPYTGCGYGHTACGAYCYAQFMPNWAALRERLSAADAPAPAWGDAVAVKANAARLLHDALRRMSSEKRRGLRIFMATTTDPYQPAEAHHRVTRGCLETFTRFPDLDLLVLQTRSPLAAQDLAHMAQVPYLWLSITVETDDAARLRILGGGPAPSARLRLAQQAAEQGIPVQITVSPCLPYTPDFAGRLLASGARRFVVDTFVDGDGSRGARTARSPFGASAGYNWRDRDPALALYHRLAESGAVVGWSTAGFCGIPPRPGLL